MINFKGRIGSVFDRLSTTHGVIVTGNMKKLLKGTLLFVSVTLS